MPPITNLSATRRTVAALRRDARLAPEHAAVIQVALTSAQALDTAVAVGEKRYVLDRLVRAHLAAVEALLRVSGRETPLDPFAAFVAGMGIAEPHPELRDG